MSLNLVYRGTLVVICCAALWTYSSVTGGADQPRGRSRPDAPTGWVAVEKVAGAATLRYETPHYRGLQGLPSPGSAELEVLTIKAARPLKVEMAHDFAGAISGTLSETPVQGSPGISGRFVDRYGDINIVTHAVYIVTTSELMKVFLCYREHDALEPEFLRALNQVLGRVGRRS